VPWPADYGGAIDMMNRIIQFQKLGINIHLHYSATMNEAVPAELNKFCESVHVYERKTGKKGLSSKYLISSRHALMKS